jgi:Rieske Fe-S protein
VHADPRDVARDAWIAVLPPETPEESLARLCEALERRGWSAAASRGPEQSILAVEGAADAGALRAALPADLEVDVFPLLGAAEYRRLRGRRRFLSALVGGLSLVLLAGLAFPLLAFLEPPPRALLAPDWVRVAAAERLDVGGAARVQVHGTPLFVVRLAGARWNALSAACTARSDCWLEWDGERRELRCPCHGCEFDGHGNVVRGPAAVPLSAREVELRGDEVFVRRTL